MTVDPAQMPRIAAASARVVGTIRGRWHFAVASASFSRRGKRSIAKAVAQIAEIAEIRKSPAEWASNAGLTQPAQIAQIAENPLQPSLMDQTAGFSGGPQKMQKMQKFKKAPKNGHRIAPRLRCQKLQKMQKITPPPSALLSRDNDASRPEMRAQHGGCLVIGLEPLAEEARQ